MEIEKRSLSGGGWASGTGTRAGIETTCYALMALHDVKGALVITALIYSSERRIQTEAGQRSKATIPKDAGQRHSLRSRFAFVGAPSDAGREGAYAGCSITKAAKLTGFGNGNSERWIAQCSSIQTSTDGRGFRAPSVGSFRRLFHSSRSNNPPHLLSD